VTTSDAIAIEVFEGPPLTVSATASASTVPTGTSVSFAAQVSGNQGSALTYRWSFGDNLPDSSSDGPSVSYADPGNYKVTLLVTDADGGGGATTVPITVTGSSTTPPAGGSSSPTPTGATGTGDNPNGGASGSTGGNGKGGGAQPSNGNGNHNGSPSATPTPSSSHQEKPSRGGSSPGAGASPTTPAHRSTPTSPTAPSGTPSLNPSASPTPPSAPQRNPAPTQRRTRRPGVRSVGPLVTGRLIADVTPLPAGSSPLVHLSPGSAAAAPRPPQPSQRSPLPAIAGCLAIVLLLGLGARRELAGPDWWRTLRPSS
jgi:PKD repeat protein